MTSYSSIENLTADHLNKSRILVSTLPGGFALNNVSAMF